MLPITPTLLLRPLQASDDGALHGLIEPLRASLPGSLPAAALDQTVRHKQFLRAHPLTIFPVQWQKRQLLGAWAGGALAGLIDVATGVEHERAGDPLALRALGSVGSVGVGGAAAAAGPAPPPQAICTPCTTRPPRCCWARRMPSGAARACCACGRTT